MELSLMCLLFAITLTATNGFSNPARKTWWSKRVVSDSFHTAGRLSERQIKYAAESIFNTVVSLNTFDSHEGDELAAGGTYLPSTTKARSIAENMAGISFEVVLDSGINDWKTVETLSKLNSIVRRSTKPLLFFSDDSYASTFLILAHYANVTKHNDNQNGEPSMSSYDVLEVGAQMGFNFGKDEALRSLLATLTESAILTSYPEPDVEPDDWYKNYWIMKYVDKNIFISGQIQSDQLDAIKSAGIEMIANFRRGDTTPPRRRKSQEEVTLLNIKDRTGTYTGSGRQSVQQLEAKRLDANKPVAYISSTSTVNYESRNPLEFGNDVGYSEKVEKQTISETLPGIKYFHLPVGGQYGYGKALWNEYKDTLVDIENKGPVLLQCRTGFRSGIVSVMTAAYINCYNSTWATTRGKEIGYDFVRSAPSTLSMLKVVLDERGNCTSGQERVSAAHLMSVSYLVAIPLVLNFVTWHVDQIWT